jgi:hypothetical protein
VQDLWRRIPISVEGTLLLSKDAVSALLARNALLLSKRRGELLRNRIPRLGELDTSSKEFDERQAETCRMLILKLIGTFFLQAILQGSNFITITITKHGHDSSRFCYFSVA